MLDVYTNFYNRIFLLVTVHTAKQSSAGYLGRRPNYILLHKIYSWENITFITTCHKIFRTLKLLH